MNHIYEVHEIRIRSCITLPHLAAREADSFDVDVQYAPVSRELSDAVERGLAYQVSSGKLLLEVEGVARFLVLGGAQIFIDRHEAADDDSIAYFLLGPVLRGLLIQRGDLVLRASAVSMHGKGILFLGCSGTGKSTIAAALAGKGHQVLADDVCVIRPGARGPRTIIPGPPRLHLWTDSIVKLEKGGFLPAQKKRSAMPKVRPSLQKRALSTAGYFSSEPLPISKIFVFNQALVSEVGLQALELGSTYPIFDHVSQRTAFLKGLGMDSSYRQRSMTLALTVPFVAISRPRRGFLLGEMIAGLAAEVDK